MDRGTLSISVGIQEDAGRWGETEDLREGMIDGASSHSGWEGMRSSTQIEALALAKRRAITSSEMNGEVDRWQCKDVLMFGVEEMRGPRTDCLDLLSRVRSKVRSVAGPGRKWFKGL